MKKLAITLAASAVALAAAAPAMAEKWDMPMAYAATNFHSEVGANFGACVTEATGGDLEIVTHPSGSLFSATRSSARCRPVRPRYRRASALCVTRTKIAVLRDRLDPVPRHESFDEHSNKLWAIG